MFDTERRLSLTCTRTRTRTSTYQFTPVHTSIYYPQSVSMITWVLLALSTFSLIFLILDFTCI